MDIMLLSFLPIFVIYWKTYRVIIGYMIFFGTRAMVQKVYFVPRIDGFIFEHPGFHSITVPYHDTNDFFYSGHVGTCFLLFNEFRSCKWYKMSFFCLFVLLNEWTMMLLIRNHYLIDMITGVILAQYAHWQAERISFLVDCKFLGVPFHKRYSNFFQPC